MPVEMEFVVTNLMWEGTERKSCSPFTPTASLTLSFICSLLYTNSKCMNHDTIAQIFCKQLHQICCNSLYLQIAIFVTCLVLGVFLNSIKLWTIGQYGLYLFTVIYCYDACLRLRYFQRRVFRLLRLLIRITSYELFDSRYYVYKLSCLMFLNGGNVTLVFCLFVIIKIWECDTSLCSALRKQFS